MRLQHGNVSQNGSIISYKTDLHGEQLSTYQQLATELKSALDINGIAHDNEFSAAHAEGQMRSRCITIYVISSDEAAKQLPYASHAIN